MSHDTLNIINMNINFGSLSIKRIWKMFVKNEICNILGFVKIRNWRKRIVVHCILNIFFVKKLRKLFSSIDIDCYIERKSGLNFKEHSAKFRIIKIKIIPFTFGILRLAGKLICRFIIKNGHFTTRFNDRISKSE